MEELTKRLELFITSRKLFEKHHKLLVAVSGGVDSVVLLRLLYELGYQVSIAHCHFNLRAEADSEADFVKALAQELRVPFHFQKFNTAQDAAREGVSIQMMARKLRYQFFEQVRQAEGYDFIVTAHHLNDSLETAILNFSKGTGIAGLRGILPKNGFVVRPLLFASKEEILEWAQKKGVKWLEDSSNATDSYTRNFIRHKIVPLFEAVNPNILQNFAENAQRLFSVEKVWRKKLEELKGQFIEEQGSICKIHFSEEIDEVILHSFLEEKGFSFRQCQEIYVSQQVGAEFFSQTHWLVRDRNSWVIVPLEFNQEIEQKFFLEANTVLQTPYFVLKNQIMDISEFCIGGSIFEAYFDAEQLEFPLLVRSWQEGDSFRPFGMKGRKKISDLLVDYKVPRNLKKRIFVLENKGEIIYVLGLRSSELTRVTPFTKKVCKITYIST